MQLLLMIFLIDILFIYSSLYELQMLQQNSYNEKNKYYHFIFQDLKKNYKTYLLKYLLAAFLIIYNSFDRILNIYFIIILGVLIISAFHNQMKHNKKLPLKFTKRLIRIFTLDYLFIILLEVFSYKLNLNYFAGLSLLYVALNPYILIFIVFLLSPIEKMVFNHYKKMALDKLSKMNDIKIIGITGSFGKTSTKMILDSILKTTYKGFYTPASFNTPNGILMTINNENTIYNDYFISEMGAKGKGEIKELCDLIHPKYAILTKIGKAHLESFGSIENICKTKFELPSSLSDDGICILNKDDEYQRNFKLKNNPKIIWTSIERKADVIAKNIKTSNEGTSFDIFFKDETTISVKTILLGHKNVYNILQAAALAKELGVPNKNIIKGIKNIPPINHRLEIKNNGNITIIDDSYNSNPEGAKNAVEVLNLMDGEKIIITPGMVEMGKEEDKLNKEFGMQIAQVCDKVFLVGPKKTKPIYDGIIEKGFDKENIIVCKSFNEAYSKATKNSKKATILIENDLPDSYTEE